MVGIQPDGGADGAATVADGGWDEGTATADAAHGPDGGADAAPDADGAGGLFDGSREQYCMGSGPPLRVGDGAGDGGVSGEPCTGRVAERLFRNALCTCNSVSMSNPFTTDAFDSRMGSFTPGGSGASVGVNVNYRNTGSADIHGSLAIGGVAGIEVTNPHTIHGDLLSNGPMEASGVVVVRRDAWVRGNIRASNGLTVGRDLYQPRDATRDGPVAVTGAQHAMDFTVPPPCACGAGDLLDVRAIVAEAERNNDNASVGLDPAVFSNLNDGIEIELPCGRFYVQEISASNPVTIRITGRTVLFVGRDVDVSNPVRVELAPGGELDLLVGGNITASNPLELGRPENAAAVRVYVGGSNVTLSGSSTFVGNLYAPAAVVRATNPMEVYGSIFAGEFVATGTVGIHYDRAILHEGRDCAGPPPSGCRTSLDCPSSEACVGGRCGRCTRDADCGYPLVCDTPSGQCVYIPG